MKWQELYQQKNECLKKVVEAESTKELRPPTIYTRNRSASPMEMKEGEKRAVQKYISRAIKGHYEREN